MSNPNKLWSWGKVFGTGTGAAAGGAATGAAMGALGGVIGAPIGAAVGAAGGFVTGVLGAAVGHWWDLPPDLPDTFGSAALYTAVTSGVLSALLFGLSLDRIAADSRVAMAAAWGIPSLSGFLASLSRSLIDDFQAKARQRVSRDTELEKSRVDDAGR